MMCYAWVICESTIKKKEYVRTDVFKFFLLLTPESKNKSLKWQVF